MKKIFSLLLVLVLIFLGALSVHGQEETVRVYINGEILPVMGKLYMDNTVIPVRAFLEKAGFTVEWNEAENLVTASKDMYTMKLWPGSDRMVINGSTHIMSCPLLEENGTTYAPVRSIGENTGFEVSWYEKSYSAVLNDGSDSVLYYEDTSSLLPEVSSVAGTEKYKEIAEDDLGMVYYTYENCPEEKIFEYGDYITSKLGYEYNSMLLGEDYSKIYVYTLGDVQTNLVVKKIEDTPYAYVFPDVNVSVEGNSYTPDTEEPIAEVVPEETVPDNKPEAKEDTKAEYYPNSTVPKFDAVVNTHLLRTEKLEGGETAYVYRGNDFGVMTYMSYLRSFGFYDYDMDIGMGFNITYTMTKGDEYVVIMSSMFSGEVYVVTGRG